MSRKNTSIVLNLHATEFAAIYAILMQVRLGERNPFEDAVSDLMIDLEDNGIEEWANNFVEQTGLELPDLMIEASNEDGVVLNLV